MIEKTRKPTKKTVEKASAVMTSAAAVRFNRKTTANTTRNSTARTTPVSGVVMGPPYR